MTTPLGPSGVLTEAFRKFEIAALQLEGQHTSLEERVRELQEELGTANRQLATVLDALDGGVAVVSAGGRVVRTNRAFEHMGFTDEDGHVDAPELLHLLSAEDGRGGTARVHRASAEGTCDFAATLIPVEDGEGTRVLTVQDVTAIRREEQESGRQSRLEALGRMAAELAHEVRNPLGSIRLFASMLCEDLPNGPPRAMAEQILAASAGLETTVSNLLAFAAPPRARHAPLDLARIAVEVCALLAPACAVRGVTLAGPRQGTDCPVEGDREALRQVVLNLVGNALDATGAGGRIVVRVERADGVVTLEVLDEGRGIAPEDLPRVFDPFFTRTEGGTGLGLSIVHRTVESHGGRITLDSRPGAGTRCRVALPAGRAGETAHD